jgi:hypothetical protein
VRKNKVVNLRRVSCALNDMARRVVVSDTMVLPAETEVNVPVRASWTGIPKVPCDWLMESNKLKRDVLVARTRIPATAPRSWYALLI